MFRKKFNATMSQWIMLDVEQPLLNSRSKLAHQVDKIPRATATFLSQSPWGMLHG
jgi:hypothetical protein